VFPVCTYGYSIHLIVAPLMKSGLPIAVSIRSDISQSLHSYLEQMHTIQFFNLS